MGVPAGELESRMSAQEFSEHIVDMVMIQKVQEKERERQENAKSLRRR